MKKMRGFIDPISLGFLIVITGAGALSSVGNPDSHKAQLMQNQQKQVVKVVHDTRQVDSNASILDECE